MLVLGYLADEMVVTIVGIELQCGIAFGIVYLVAHRGSMVGQKRTRRRTGWR